MAAAANGRQLGPHLASRRLASPLSVGGGSLLVAVVSLGLLVLVASLGDDRSGFLYMVLRFFALFFCFLFVGALAYGIAALVRGSQSFHAYVGGFVHRHRSKVRVLIWPEVAELRPVIGKRGDAAGKIQHYELALHDGGRIAIPLNIVNGRDEFMDHLMAVLQRGGIPVR